MVPDAGKALVELKKRAAAGLYTPPEGKPMEIQVGVNKRRQINLYDPDGTRIELMEAHTIDGTQPPNSTAPVPHPGG
jgi:lactoylglutathione lyase